MVLNCQRKNKTVALVLAIYIIVCSFLSGGCINRSKFTIPKGLNVCFIDVGQGDATLFLLPDNKSMLIDGGNGGDFSNENLLATLKKYSIKCLDYLVLTHPDADHVGGVPKILKTVSVKTAFVPVVWEKENYTVYKQAYDSISQLGAKIEHTELGVNVKGEDYFIAFLSPYNIENEKSSYREFNFNDQPTGRQINDVSPFIYLEYKGVSFLLTGDAGENQESNLIADYKSGLFENLFSSLGVGVNLTNIDFLKVAHHGAEDCTSTDFLSLINPINSVISIGGDNSYGHPATNTLKRLTDHNSKIWRTDYHGTVSVNVSPTGKLKTTSQSGIKP